MKNDPTTPIERIMARSTLNEKTGCVECSLHRDKNGYSTVRVRVNGVWRMRRVHRVVYESLVGPIPGDMTVDHICRNVACCNPEHLRLLSHVENSAGSRTCVENTSKTHCPKGHEYDTSNAYLRNGKHRECRACSRMRSAVLRSNRTKTRCPKGHEYGGARNAAGHLTCLKCRKLGINNRPIDTAGKAC